MSGAGIVYVVDDDPSMCDLIAASLQPASLTVKTFSSAEQFAGVNIPADSAGQPSCLLLDLEMPGISGLEFLEKRFNSQPPCPVIIVTARGSVGAAVKSMKLGAVDFLEKPFSPDVLRAIVLDTLQKHQTFFAQSMRKEAVRSRLALLSPREAELLDAIVQGKSTKMIADSLGISARTVDHHRANLMDKMHATNVADVVRMAVEADYQTVERAKGPAPAENDGA